MEMTTENNMPGIDLDDTTRAELERAGVIVSSVDFLYNWARGGSVWPLCCARSPAWTSADGASSEACRCAWRSGGPSGGGL